MSERTSWQLRALSAEKEVERLQALVARLEREAINLQRERDSALLRLAKLGYQI